MLHDLVARAKCTAQQSRAGVQSLTGSPAEDIDDTSTTLLAVMALAVRPPGSATTYNWSFRDLWGALFALFLVGLIFGGREGQFGVVEELLLAVTHMQTSHFLQKLLGLSPTSMKQRAKGSWYGACRNRTEGSGEG